MVEARREFSEQTAAQVDVEVRRLVTRAEERAKSVLNQHRDELQRLAELLCERETLQGDELRQVLGPAQQVA